MFTLDELKQHFIALKIPKTSAILFQRRETEKDFRSELASNPGHLGSETTALTSWPWLLKAFLSVAAKKLLVLFYQCIIIWQRWQCIGDSVGSADNALVTVLAALDNALVTVLAALTVLASLPMTLLWLLLAVLPVLLQMQALTVLHFLLVLIVMQVCFYFEYWQPCLAMTLITTACC